MSEFKKEFLIKKINKEVEDFHPLLDELFSRMKEDNNYRNIYYNHGNEEYGADFIIIQDDCYGTIDVIGIVVKNGNVRSRDLPNICMQIDQCFETERNVSGYGKMFINIVIVLTNGDFSNNVSNTIISKYRNKTVKFLNQNALIQLLDKYYPVFWEDIDGNLAEFLTKGKVKMIALDSKLSLTQNVEGDAYIEPRISKSLEPLKTWEKKQGKTHKIKKTIDIYSEINENDVIFIESGMGGGKSKLMRRIFTHYSEPKNFKQEKIIPLYISFSDLYEIHKLEIDNFIKENTHEIEENVSDSTILLLIDGADEMMLQNESLFSRLNELCCQIVDKKVKLFISSRYFGEYEYEGHGIDKLSITKCSIEPFNTEELVRLIKLINKSINITNKLVQDMENKNLFKEMRRTPIVGVILARILQDDKAELPTNLPELYQKYSEIVLGRWDIDKELLADKEYNVILEVTKQIAVDFIDNQREYMAYDEFADYFSQYIEERPYSFTTESLLNKLVKRSTFYYFDFQNRRVYFRHRSFSEFYYAVSKAQNGKLEMSEKAFHPYWTNVFYFYLGLKRDCEEELLQLTKMKPSSPMQSIVKYVNFSNFIMAAYDTRTTILCDVLIELILDAAKYANETLENKHNESPFNNLPRVFVVMLFTIIISENYSYEFIHRMLKDSITKIDLKSNYHQIDKSLAGFFIAMLGLELNNNVLLKEYIKKFRAEMPLEVKLLLKYYTSQDENIKLLSSDQNLKKSLKSIKRNMRSQSPELLNSVLKEPIKNVDNI